MNGSPGLRALAALAALFCPLVARAAAPVDAAALAQDVRAETLLAWRAYEAYAWPHDELLPLSRSHRDWYNQAISIAPIDAYGTLRVMGFDDEARRVESFVVHDLSFDKDTSVKVFEVNIRIVGGLLCMYEMTRNPAVLAKARDIGDRLLPAFNSPTGLPYCFVNLRTGAVRQHVVNVAEAGSSLLEFGVLSYCTGDPKYYQAARRASLKLAGLSSKLGLPGRDVDILTGEWKVTKSMVGACADSYYEYLYKSWLLFHDPEIKRAWDASIAAIQAHVAERRGPLLWYGIVDMNTGRKVSSRVMLYDAFFPGLLALSGDLPRAEASEAAWDTVWSRHGLIPMEYDYDAQRVTNPHYELNPELIESTFYLWRLTRDPRYLAMEARYYADLRRYCRTDIAYTHIGDVVTKRKVDEMETFFIAETMKYFYMAFAPDCPFNPETCVFSTEAHPFPKANFREDRIRKALGIP
jgi:Glycosyl hydrolase family 47